MKILNQHFDATARHILVITVDEWPEPIRINVEAMAEAPTLSAIQRMVKATITRKKREADMLAMETRARNHKQRGAEIPAGRHEARNFR